MLSRLLRERDRLAGERDALERLLLRATEEDGCDGGCRACGLAGQVQTVAE